MCNVHVLGWMMACRWSDHRSSRESCMNGTPTNGRTNGIVTSFHLLPPLALATGYSIFNIRHSTFNVQHSTLDIGYSVTVSTWLTRSKGACTTLHHPPHHRTLYSPRFDSPTLHVLSGRPVSGQRVWALRLFHSSINPNINITAITANILVLSVAFFYAYA